MEKYDLIVVGAGPGGYVAAERAGALGKKVLLIEKDKLGGVCMNRGCIPTKALLNAAKTYKHALEGEKFGVTFSDARFDMAKVQEWKKDTTATLCSGIEYLMKANKVTVVFGEAEFIDNHNVKVGDNVYSTDYIILANGSSPAMPPIEGAKGKNVVTSDGILELTSIPKSLVVIGGGVIGIEFASFFSMLGTKVSVVEMMDEILPMMDGDFAKLMRKEMNVEFNLGCKVVKISEQGVTYLDKKGESHLAEGELVLMCVGRRANTQGLEKLGLKIDRVVCADDTMKTNVSNVYAIGDLNGKSQLAHSASRMAEVAVDNIFGTKKQVWRGYAVPWAVYGLPEAAGCGLTEQAAAKAGIEVKCAVSQMRANGRFLAENGKKASGMVKVVSDARDGRILGIHIIGPYASEMIWGAAAVIEDELRVKDMKEIIFPHPSVAELIRDTCWSIK